MGLSLGLRVTSLGALLFAALAWAVVRPDLMVVERIEWVGNSRATPAQLRHLADLRNGTTIWSVDLGDLTARIQRHPWVDRVSAERRFPGTVVVRVVEHDPVAVLAWDDELFYVDAQGRPFLRADTSDLDHPFITGLDPSLEVLHPELPRLAIRDAVWLLESLDGRSLIPSDRVSEIAFHRTRGFTVQTTGASGASRTARVLFGFEDYERQLAHLGSLLDRGVDLTRPLHVDVAPATVAIVRPISSSAGAAPSGSTGSAPAASTPTGATSPAPPYPSSTASTWM